MRRRQCFQRIQRFFRLEVLYRSKHRIHHNNNKDHDGALHISGQHRHHRRNDQNDNEQIQKLLRKDAHRTFFLCFLQAVFSHLLSYFQHLALRQTIFGGVLVSKNFFLGHLVNFFHNHDPFFFRVSLLRCLLPCSCGLCL